MLFSSNSRLALAGFAFTCAVTSASNLDRRQDNCKDVHVFLAKGNNEPYPGRQGKLAGAICYGLDSCDYEDIQYYNPYEADYCTSVTEGARNGQSQVTAYAERCPDSKLVLSGYSQGAQVVGDVLGGGGGVFFHNCTQPVNGPLDPTTSPGNKIVATLLFGDTRHMAGQPYNVESGADAVGIFPRSDEQLATLNRYSNILRSYCVASDPICAASFGSEDATEHLTYFDVFSDAAAAWVKEMINKAEQQSSKTSSVAFTTTSASTKSSAAATSASVSASALPTLFSAPFGNSTTNSTTSSSSSATTISSTLSAAVGSSTTVSSGASATSAVAGSTTSSGPRASPTIADVNAATRVQGLASFVLPVVGALVFAL